MKNSSGGPVEDDPLPNDEHDHSDDGHSKNDLVAVNVTNEMGQTKPHLTNGFVLLIFLICKIENFH